MIEGLGQKVDSATGVAVGNALNTLRQEVDLAAPAMQQLRRLTLAAHHDRAVRNRDHGAGGVVVCANSGRDERAAR